MAKERGGENLGNTIFFLQIDSSLIVRSFTQYWKPSFPGLSPKITEL